MTDKALFNDGNRKIDYVLVYSIYIGTEEKKIVSKYIENIKRNGLQTEEEQGVVLEDLVCVKIHAPDNVLKEFAEVFKIDLTKDNPHYKRQKTPIRWAANILTYPNENHPVFQRASYWASFGFFYCYQPLNLIEKYYGPEVGFYFAWIGFYTQTLIVASLIGLVCFIIGLIIYAFDTFYIENEVCNSDQFICPVCPSEKWCSFTPIKYLCTMMKIAYVLENPVTLLYSIFMTFWGVIFMVLWKRKEAMLRMRWNVSKLPKERFVRPAFIEAARLQRVSSITGDTEHYFTMYDRIMTRIISFFIFLIVFLGYTLGVVFVMQYRLNILYYGRRSNSKTLKHLLEFIESLSSSFLTYFIMNFFDCFKNKLCRIMTIWENPRTQDEFEARYLMKVIILSFGNVFFPVVYLAYFKGKFFSYPGDTTQWSLLGMAKADVCPLSGCLVDLSMQLLAIMSTKNLMRLFKEILIPYARVYFKKKAPRDPTIRASRWEEDYALVKNKKNFLHAEYIQMALQYGFMTFFVVALPIAPIFAFANNILEIRFDAMKLLKKAKRTVPEYSSGIETWNTVMLVITILGCISNPLLIAFSSNLIPRYIYRRSHDGLTGYVNSTISEFLVKELPNMVGHNKNTTCYYYGRRYPPSHPQKYELTRDYWHQLAIKSVGFIVLENICLLFSLFLNYAIPTIPRKVEIKMEYEQDLLRKSRLQSKLVS